LELIGVQLLGPSTKLRTLELLDDQAQAVHFDPALVHGAGEIAHELVQHIDIARQGIEREAHAQPGQICPSCTSKIRRYPAVTGCQVLTGVRHSNPSNEGLQEYPLW
jgi:hypothetical protein